MDPLIVLPEEVAGKAYDDVAHPPARWVGKTFGAWGHAFYVIMGLPVDLWAEREEEMKRKFAEEVRGRVDKIPVDQRIEPTFGVVKAVLEGVDDCIDEEVLRAGFVNLLCCSIDSKKSNPLLRTYASTLRQLCSDEARILRRLYLKGRGAFIRIIMRKEKEKGYMVLVEYFSDIGKEANCMNDEMLPQYIVHMETLGLISTSTIESFTDDSRYERLREQAKPIKEDIEKDGLVFDFKRGLISITPLGEDFAKVCDFSE